MAFEIFTALVGVLAVVYAGAVKFIQNKLIDRKEMEEFQAESKRLSAEFDKAKKADNKKKMDEVMKKQMEFLPKMNSIMLKQFKPMIFILVVFFGVTWLIGHFDPTVQDDITLNMSDDGKGCDAAAGDGIFSACYKIDSANYGKWVFSAKSLNGGSEAGHNSTFFLYNSNESDNYAEGPKGEPLMVSTDKAYYTPGETVRLFANSTAKAVEARLDNGTSFKVDLPFSIPIVNVQRIQQPYWWFIFISLIANLSISAVMGRIQKSGEKK
ncbi:MAG: EMC3/TMCO1 family protein [Candidatus Micrarchaeia archaeon]